MLAYLLVVIGALNWGLKGLLQVDLVELLFGTIPWLQQVIYVLVGAAGVYVLVEFNAYSKVWGKKK